MPKNNPPIDVPCLTISSGDMHHLAELWVTQPDMVLHYGQQLADATADMDAAKCQLAVVEGTLQLDIRQDPGAYSLDKVTETVIAAAVVTHDDHIDATAIYNRARARHNTLRCILDALGHRKSALQGLTDLWLRQYYADGGPTTPSETTPKPEELMTTVNQRRRRRSAV